MRHVLTHLIPIISFLSLIGHLLGAYSLYFYVVIMQSGGDSLFYFNGHNIFEFQFNFATISLYLILKISSLLRLFFFKDHILPFFLFSGTFSFIGSLFYFLTYRRLLGNHFIAALVLMLWPSYFFFSAGIVKESTIFVGIALFFFVLAREKKDVMGFCILCFCGFAFLLRPYLIVLILIAMMIFLFLQKKYLPFFLFLLLLILCAHPLFSYLNMYSSTPFELSKIGEFIISQQMKLNHGTYIPMLTHDPIYIFFTIPYFFLMQLFLPLGWGAHNFLTYLASLENAFLLALSVWFLYHWHYFLILVKEKPIFKFFFIYFVIGMTAISMLSINLGLAMREKMMFVPALLLCILGTYAQKTKS